jgi:hypothetical protein
MAPELKYTEKDLILARRSAFMLGAAYGEAFPVMSFAGRIERSHIEFPLPKVERPRVVRDVEHMNANFNPSEWRFVNGELERRDLRFDEWASSENAVLTVQRIKLLADLLANPTELVEDDDSPTAPSTLSPQESEGSR